MAQPIDDFVERFAKLPTGKYTLPWMPKISKGFAKEIRRLLSQEDEAALRGLSVYGKSPTSKGSQANAVATWTAARAEWEEHLSTLSPGRQLYFTTIFVHLVGDDNLNLCRGILGVGKASTKAKVLKKWMAANPATAEGELDIEGKSISPLHLLLESVDAVFKQLETFVCSSKNPYREFVPVYCMEVAQMAMMLLEASAPFDAVKDKSVLELCGEIDLHPGHELPMANGEDLMGICSYAGEFRVS